MARVGGYSLDLYCSNWKSGPASRDPTHTYREFPHNYFGPDRANCYRQARREGWILGRGRELCPKCSGKK